MLTRRQFLPAVSAPLLAQTSKPNLIVIISDDHHWQCLGAAGNPHIHTPNLDKLAGRGVLFSEAIISTPQCSPSRGVLLSGQESYQTGLDCNDPNHMRFRSFNGPTAVEQLRRSGYATTLVGKWHIRNSPRECGFTNAPLWLQAGAGPYLNLKMRHGIDAQTDTETPGHVSEVLTNAAIDVVREAKSPYLLWLAYTAPHTPWTASEQYRDRYRGRNAEIAPPKHPKPLPARAAAASTEAEPRQAGRRNRAFDWETYYAVISELDANIGRLIESVERAGQWDNTLILFIGDNGYLAGSKGLDGKVYAWEQSIRVPFIAAGGLAERATKSTAPVASIDVPATLLDYAGVRPHQPVFGTSLRSVFSGGKFTRDVAFSAWTDGRPEALVAGYAVEPWRVARTGTHKYIVWESKKQALYDLNSDPFEENNLFGSAAHAKHLRQLKDLLRRRMRETSDPAVSWLS